MSPFITRNEPGSITTTGPAWITPVQNHKKISVGTLVRILSLETGAWDNKGRVRYRDWNGRSYCVETSKEGSLVIRWRNGLIPIPVQGSTQKNGRVRKNQAMPSRAGT